MLGVTRPLTPNATGTPSSSSRALFRLKMFDSEGGQDVVWYGDTDLLQPPPVVSDKHDD